jgi:hypothetical protein
MDVLPKFHKLAALPNKALHGLNDYTNKSEFASFLER